MRECPREEGAEVSQCRDNASRLCVRLGSLDPTSPCCNKVPKMGGRGGGVAGVSSHGSGSKFLCPVSLIALYDFDDVAIHPKQKGSITLHLTDLLRKAPRAVFGS